MEAPGFGTPEQATAAEQEKAYRQLLRQSSQMRELLELRAWKAYREVIESQINLWLSVVVQPSETGDQLLIGQYNKGVLAGLRLALGTPESIVAQAAQAAADSEDEPDESED